MRSPQHVWCLMGGFLMQALSNVFLNKSIGIQAKLSHQIQDPLHTFLLLSGTFYTLVPPDLGLEHAGSISIIAPTQWRHLSWVRRCIAFRKLHRYLESFRYMGTMTLFSIFQSWNLCFWPSSVISGSRCIWPQGIIRGEVCCDVVLKHLQPQPYGIYPKMLLA